MHDVSRLARNSIREANYFTIEIRFKGTRGISRFNMFIFHVPFHRAHIVAWSICILCVAWFYHLIDQLVCNLENDRCFSRRNKLLPLVRCRWIVDKHPHMGRKDCCFSVDLHNRLRDTLFDLRYEGKLKFMSS